VIITAGGDTQKATASLDAEKEQAVLTVAKELPAGPAEIRIRFTGILNDKLRAFYLSRSAPKIRRDAVRSDRCTSRVPMLR
jgi:aminopeptidase N/puromycin-sensitive aminopeptidase